MKKERFFLLDIIRMISFFSIVVYHGNSQVFYPAYEPLLHQGTIYSVLALVARCFSFSGFSIFILSFFLFGRWHISTEKKKTLYGLMGVGTLVLMMSASDNPFLQPFWDWDIYELLIVSVASILLLQKHPRLTMVFGIIGFIMTLIPFYKLADAESIPLIARRVLVGVCDDQGRGGWALLPWIGLAWMCFSLGAFSMKDQCFLYLQKGLGRLEVLFWIPLLSASVFFWGNYYDVPLDHRFYCFMFHRPSYIFWSHLIWVFLLIRVSFITKVNSYLEKFAAVRWLSQLKISTNFGLCYLLQLTYLWIASLLWADFMKQNFFWFDVFIVSILPVTEIMGALIVRLTQEHRTGKR